MESPFLMSSIFQKGDSIFYAVLLLTLFSFVAIESLWLIRRMASPGKAQIPREHMELVWSIIPAAIFLTLTYV